MKLLARALAAYSAGSTAYLLALLAAAAAPRRGAAAPPAGVLPRMVVLVPAHDEAAGIGDAVRALVGAEYPDGLREVVVIADNCTDATADLARDAGATVWERDAPDDPGKGQAVRWALDRAARERPATEAVAMVDADCVASANLLLALGRAIAAGADAVQADYVVANPEASPSAALRFAGFALINTVRPRGKDRLGLSCGLLGPGMAFARPTLEAVPWEAFSITEDREYHLRLVATGRRARFATEASVASPMPTTAAQGATQQVRWDTGNALLVRRWTRPLLARALRHRDVGAAHAAVELLIPPQSTLAAASLGAVLSGVTAGSQFARRAGTASVAGQAAYVLGGLALVRAPAPVFAALVRAPALVARRLAQQAAIAGGRGAATWERTGRESAG